MRGKIADKLATCYSEIANPLEFKIQNCHTDPSELTDFLCPAEIAEMEEIILSGIFGVALTVLRPVLMLKAHGFPCMQASR